MAGLSDIVGLAGDASTGGLASVATGILGSVLSSFNVGDAVPNYPIKSQNTLQGIVQSVSGNFPTPSNVSEAQALLNKAMQYRQGAQDKINSKGGETKDPTDTTYRMFYDQVIGALQNYLHGGSYGNPTMPVNDSTAIPGGNYDITGGNHTLSASSVGGISLTTILLIVAALAAVIITVVVIKKK